MRKYLSLFLFITFATTLVAAENNGIIKGHSQKKLYAQAKAEGRRKAQEARALPLGIAKKRLNFSDNNNNEHKKLFEEMLALIKDEQNRLIENARKQREDADEAIKVLKNLSLN